MAISLIRCKNLGFDLFSLFSPTKISHAASEMHEWKSGFTKLFSLLRKISPAMSEIYSWKSGFVILRIRTGMYACPQMNFASYSSLLYTDWNTQRIIWSDWLRGSPYVGVRTGVWTGQTHWHNKPRSNSVKFHRLLFYLCRYTIKLLLTEISFHTGNICSDIQGAWTSLRSVHTPWMSEQIFPRMDIELG